MSDTEDTIIVSKLNKENDTNVEWCSQHEDILVEWADKAICYRWLHATSHSSYSFKSRWFTIPVIIMSTLTGTANFAQERIPVDYQPMYTIIVGSINIFAGIITTVQQFLKINELNESHRVSSIGWDKFYRNIKLELAKSRAERMHVFQMLKISKEEFDRLMETSPTVDKKIILQFNKKFSNKSMEINDNKNQLHKPEICDALESTRNFLYAETIEDKAKNKTKDLVKYAKENNEFKRKSVTVTNFISDFNKEFKREPTIDEIHDNLKDNVSDNIINTVIDIDGNNKPNGFNL